MDFKRLFSKFMGLRNKPRSSKSRWRKTLDRRFRPHVVIEARRPWPYITVQWNPKSAEEERRIVEYTTMVQLSMCTVGVVPAMISGLGKEQPCQTSQSA